MVIDGNIYSSSSASIYPYDNTGTHSIGVRLRNACGWGPWYYDNYFSFGRGGAAYNYTITAKSSSVDVSPNSNSSRVSSSTNTLDYMLVNSITDVYVFRLDEGGGVMQSL